MMSDLTDALEALTLAVRFDQMKDTDKAVLCYRKAARFLDRGLSQNAVPTEQILTYRNKVKECLERATALESQKERNQQAESDRMLLQFHFLMQQALDADEAGLRDPALHMYMQAVELAVKLKESDKKEDCKSLAKKALDRAEELKGIKFSNLSINEPKTTAAVSHNKAILQREQSVNLQVTGKHTYTEEEKEVLRLTSNINDNTFLPFMDVDLSERFQYAIPFTDRAGELRLSPKQARELDCWLRPHDLCAEPRLFVGDIDCYSIRQTIVSDCSFVASLAVGAQHERRFPADKPVLSGVMFPRDRRGRPVYNPFGKYMVKLHLNGVRRKVIIDDRLPFSRDGRLLCSYSSNKSEFWVSLLEKAYMKVMGGYDFPGSNSNIDLHALTGWIPERVALRPGEHDFHASQLFAMLERRLAAGHVLVTVATGALDDVTAERSGLVPAHAYAVLDVRQEGRAELLKLKNPWSHVRWRGNYSELDSASWTPSLRSALAYDPDSAAQYDNGVFWIDFQSILKFFDVFYLNWKPDLFKYTFCTHQKWELGAGPTKDVYSVGENPQFLLTSRGPGVVWLLLTRHITRLADFRDNREYITLLVFRSRRRVFLRHHPPPLIEGVPINSPHYLCKLDVSAGDSHVLAVSQYEKTRTIYYTLRAYATVPFALTKIDMLPYVQTISGSWSGPTAGGSENHPTYCNNPRFTLSAPAPHTARAPHTPRIVLELRGPRQYSLGLAVTVSKLHDAGQTAPFRRQATEAYMSGYTVLELEAVPGQYEVTAATFSPRQEGPFLLHARSDARIQLAHAS